MGDTSSSTTIGPIPHSLLDIRTMHSTISVNLKFLVRFLEKKKTSFCHYYYNRLQSDERGIMFVKDETGNRSSPKVNNCDV